MHQALAEGRVFDRATEVAVTCRERSAEWSDNPPLYAELAWHLGCPSSAEAIADAVLAAAPRPVVLWLDDVHHLVGSERLVDELLRLLPNNGHLVLVGRQIPPVSTARLGLEGRLVELGEDDLRFDTDERAAFLHLRGQHPADQQPDTESAATTSGWPAVMELELVAGRSGAVGYLTEEVLVEMEPDRLAALQALAPADTVDAAMLNAVTDYRGSVDNLMAGLPLVSPVAGNGNGSGRGSGSPEDETGPVVIHDLLRHALRTGMKPEAAADATAAVAYELLRRDDLVGAVRRFVEIGDRDGVERVGARLLADLHVATDVGDRLGVVDMVCQFLGDDAMSLALRGVTMAIIEPLGAEALLMEAIDQADCDNRIDLVSVCTVRLADLAYNRSERGLLDELKLRLDRLAEIGDPTASRFRFMVEVWSVRLAGDDREALRLLDVALAGQGSDVLDDEMAGLAHFYRTLILAYRGRIREALDTVTQLAPRLPPGLFADRLDGFVAILLWMVGEQTEEIRTGTVHLLDRIEGRGQQHLFVGGAGTTAIFAASAGDMTTAAALVARAEAGLDGLPPDAWANHSLAQARAVVELLNGNEDRAAEVLESAIPEDGPVIGIPHNIYGLTAALSYVLVPRVRPMWDELWDQVWPGFDPDDADTADGDGPVGQELAVRQDVARALVAFRDSGDTSGASALPWGELHRLRPWAFEPHLAELAVAAVAGGCPEAKAALAELRHDAVEVLDRLVASGSPAVAAAATETITTTPRRPAAKVDLGVLGPLSVRRGGTEESDHQSWRRARVRDLLSLLIHRDTVTRREAAAALWPDKAERAGQNNLRSNLSNLLTTLEPDRRGAAPSWFIRTAGDKLRLVRSEYLAIDVDRFEAHREAAVSLDTTAPRLALTEHLRACDLYRGDYMAGSSIEDAVYFNTIRLRSDYVASAVRAADLLVSMGEPEQAEELAVRASSFDPLNEPLQRALVSSLVAQRRFGAAKDVLGTLLGQLRSLQIPPEPETRLQAERLQLVV
ncbi:MAG: BTAD domain-containing putative transcriptional regulator [Actinomycetota bacterium]